MSDGLGQTGRQSPQRREHEVATRRMGEWRPVTRPGSDKQARGFAKWCVTT